MKGIQRNSFCHRAYSQSLKNAEDIMKGENIGRKKKIHQYYCYTT